MTIYELSLKFESIKYFLNFIFLGLIYLYLGPVIAGGFLILNTYFALIETISSFNNETTVRFFKEFNEKEKGTWLVFTLLVKIILSIIVALVIFLAIEHGYIFKNYQNFDQGEIISLLAVYLIHNLLAFSDNFFKSIQKYELILKLNVTYFFLKFTLVTSFLLSDLISIYWLVAADVISLFAWLVLLMLNINSNLKILESTKKTVKLISNIFSNYSAYKLINIPFSYAKTNLPIILIAPLLPLEHVFIFAIFQRGFNILKFLLSKPLMNLVQEKSTIQQLSRSYGFNSSKFVIFALPYVGILSILLYVLVNFNFFNQDLVVYFYLLSLDIVLFVISNIYLFKILSSENITKHTFLLLLPNIIYLSMLLIPSNLIYYFGICLIIRSIICIITYYYLSIKVF